jgi:conjugative transfer region lipoprotein (TIGR03751 family)
MESVYDSMQADESDAPLGTNGSKKLSDIRDEVSKQIPKPSEYDFKKYQPSSLNGFKRISNPELTLYVYPHFAEFEQVPVPEYTTEFSLYNKTHYVIDRNGEFI